MNNKKWEPDKWKHFYWGIPLGFLIQLTAYYFIPGNAVFAITLALILLMAICYGFEIVSLITRKGHYDMIDAIAGIAGGLIGMLPINIYKVTIS